MIFCKAKSSDCVQLKHCLNCYDKDSRKLINFEKFALSFTPNTRHNVKEEICSMFGVTQVQGHNMYLALLTFSMKNKRIQFGYLRDRVTRKLLD